MDTMPEKHPMEDPPPLAGLDPADLLRQGAADDTFADGASSSFVAPSVEELAPLFPQFEILELIGQGGMGAVYKVRQKDLDRIVALKILPPGIGQTPEFSNRFTREARALAKLNHPGIVILHEFGQQDGLYFILMEFVDGVNLAQLMKTGRISPREALAIVPQICDALQYAHDQGIVHRDIKPENILLDRLGRVKVADFGIAKVVAAVSATAIRGGDITVPTENTLAGKIIGTPQYMAPEQIDNPSDVDHRADIYALGVVFYQMLTGELPGKDLQAPSRFAHIDIRLDEIVLRAMEQMPEMRYQTAVAFRTMIVGMCEPEKLTDHTSESADVRDALESDNFSRSGTIKPPWLQALIGLFLVFCLPASLVVPFFQENSGSRWHRMEDVFTAPGQEDQSRVRDSLVEILSHYQNIELKIDSSNKRWKVSIINVHREVAEQKLDQVSAAIHREFEKHTTRKLSQPIVFESRSSISSSAMPQINRPAFVSNLNKSLPTGLILSAVGMLFLWVRRERNRFQLRNPGKLVLLGVMLGCFGCLFIPLPYRDSWNYLLFGGVLMGASLLAVSLGGRFMRFESSMVVGIWISTIAFLLVGLRGKGSQPDTGWELVPLPVQVGGFQPAMKVAEVQEGEGGPMGNRFLEGVIEWLGEIDAGSYEKAWSEAGAFARLLESPSQWATRMAVTRSSMGNMVDRKLARREWTSKLAGAPEGQYIIFDFLTHFESTQRMLERVTLMFEDDGNWRVVGYSIQKDPEAREHDVKPATLDDRE